MGCLGTLFEILLGIFIVIISIPVFIIIAVLLLVGAIVVGVLMLPFLLWVALFGD